MRLATKHTKMGSRSDTFNPRIHLIFPCPWDLSIGALQTEPPSHIYSHAEGIVAKVGDLSYNVLAQLHLPGRLGFLQAGPSEDGQSLPVPNESGSWEAIIEVTTVSWPEMQIHGYLR